MSLRNPEPQVRLSITLDTEPKVIVTTPDGVAHDLTDEFVDVRLTLDHTGCSAQLTGRFGLDQLDVGLSELAVGNVDRPGPDYQEFTQLALTDHGMSVAAHDVMWDYFAERGLAPSRLG